MKPGRWSDRIAAAKQRGVAKRRKKVVKLEQMPKVKPSRRVQAEEWNRQWRKRIEDARARGRERARMYHGQRIYEAGICIGYKNPEPERAKMMPDGRPKLKLELD